MSGQQRQVLSPQCEELSPACFCRPTSVSTALESDLWLIMAFIKLTWETLMQLRNQRFSEKFVSPLQNSCSDDSQ